MNALELLNPAVVFLNFIIIMLVTVFAMNPLVSVLSLAAALTLFIINGGKGRGVHLAAALSVIGCCVINPVFSHNGKTVLFVVYDRPVTAQALLYGAAAGVMVAAVLYWSVSFNAVMTSDRVIYTLGRLSPKAALVTALALRFVPLFIREARSINDAQKVMGIYKEETIVSRFRGGVRVFSALLTCVTEKTLITADSMAARGYAGERRRPYPLFSMKTYDLLFLAAMLLFGAAAAYAGFRNAFFYDFYPQLSPLASRPASVVGYCCCGLLFFLPAFAQGGVKIRWDFSERRSFPSRTRTREM